MRPAAPPLSGEALWRAENVEFTTVGIDIGSATSHLQFSLVRLQRRRRGLSSRFAVTERRSLYRSPVIFTPYLADGRIDSAAVGRFAEKEGAAAGLGPRQVDSGAVILTGEALRRKNARPLAVALAERAGVFVCATAGHHLEAKLAAHGSGAAALSARAGQVIAHLDIGGGTTKLALLRDGRVLATAAIAVGGRLLVFDHDGRLAWLSEAGALLARTVGVQLALGQPVSAADRGRVAAEMAGLLVSLLEGEIPARYRPLLLTGPATAGPAPEIVTFSGGVAEYLYGRAEAGHGDLGVALAAAIRDVMAPRGLPWPPPDPGEGIRATVIGASQFSVEVSGNTICVPDPARLPLRDVPVAIPAVDLTGDVDPVAIARQVGAEWRRLAGATEGPVALAFRWSGDPSHQRLRCLAEGIRSGTGARPDGQGTEPLVVVLLDGDVGRGLGRILLEELDTSRFICLDGVEVAEFDYIDVGSLTQPAGVVPVVVKSLLFGS